MTEPNGEPTALELAQQALAKTNAEKHPKLYQAREQNVKALQAYEQQKSRAELAEKKAREKYKKPASGEGKTPKSQPSEGFDYGQMAYLTANGIKPDEYHLVQDWMRDTGKELKDVIENKRFQGELADDREFKASKAAAPSPGKRSAKSTKDSVDYWVSKGDRELPPNTPENRELRRQIVNARLKVAKTGNKFSDVPVIQ